MRNNYSNVMHEEICNILKELLNGPIPSSLEVFFYIINQKSVIPGNDFHCIITWFAFSSAINAFAYFVVLCSQARWRCHSI